MSKKGPIIYGFHVDSESKLCVLKVVIPGARIDILWSATVELKQKYTFSQVVTHVGANYVPSTFSSRHFHVGCPPRNWVTNEIKDFLVALDNHFDCNIVFSSILPQMNATNISDINAITSEVIDFCIQGGFNWIRSLAFVRKNNRLDPSLFARDGIHLGPKGIAALLS